MIRRATERDAAGITRCLAAAFEPYRSAYTPGAFADTVLTEAGACDRLEQMTILVAEDEHGSIVGTIGHQVEPSGIGHLRGMAVLPSSQATGIAAELLSEAEDDLFASGCRRVSLDSTRPLIRAIAFYERHGYSPTGEVADFHGMELLQYAKLLTP